MLSDFLYSEEATMGGMPNCPIPMDGTEAAGMRGLCAAILDRVVDKFGPISITFGYAGPELWRKLSCNAEFGLHCFRPNQGGIGGACDILVHLEPDTRKVLNWIRDNCVYDRLIIFPGSRILCVAWTEIEPRRECKEWVLGDNNKLLYVTAGREGPPTPRFQSKTVQGKLLTWLLIFLPVPLIFALIHK